MARPRKEEHERRTISARTDLTPAEKEYLRGQAALAGMTEAEFIRKCVMGFSVQPKVGSVDSALISELNRIGVNVNQLARAQNADREFRGDWQAIEIELRRVIALVMASCGTYARRVCSLEMLALKNSSAANSALLVF